MLLRLLLFNAAIAATAVYAKTAATAAFACDCTCSRSSTLPALPDSLTEPGILTGFGSLCYCILQVKHALVLEPLLLLVLQMLCLLLRRLLLSVCFCWDCKLLPWADADVLATAATPQAPSESFKASLLLAKSQRIDGSSLGRTVSAGTAALTADSTPPPAVARLKPAHSQT